MSRVDRFKNPRARIRITRPVGLGLQCSKVRAQYTSSGKEEYMFYGTLCTTMQVPSPPVLW